MADFRVFSKLLNPCYSTITDLVAELNGVEFNKFGMSLLDEQARVVKSKISEVESCLSNAISQVDEVGMRIEQQQKELFSKNIEMEKFKMTKSKKKRENEIMLSETERKLRQNELEIIEAEFQVSKLKHEISNLTIEKSSLGREIDEISKELKCLESKFKIRKWQKLV